jgi:hypothetical protein
MGRVSNGQQATGPAGAPATTAERLAAIIRYVQHASERAEQLAHAALVHHDRAEAARRYAEQAAHQIARGLRGQ